MSITERCAVYFVREGYSTDTARLLGRNAAGEGFLRAYFDNPPGGEVACVYRARADAQAFATLANERGLAARVRSIATSQLREVNASGNVFFPGPQVGKLAWARARTPGAHFSVCGITHTTASHGAMDAIADLLSAPVAPWDALICTSAAVVTCVTSLLDKQEAYLRERLRATHFERPRLALIPLGVHCADFTPNPQAKAQARAALQIGADEVVFLFVGRLSFHAKANPAPMYLALEAAAKASEKKLVLIQAGWFANDKIEAAFRDGARALCPTVRTLFVDGRVAHLRTQAWQCADVFTSLSDNIQETFGLTPVEAMAAGLPCVVTDWNGYRDTVRDGVDGMLVPTCMPAPGFGADLAARHEDDVDHYDRYIGGASLFVAVDVRAAAHAYARLARDADLRARMGQQGRERALRAFDWPVVLKRYDALWAELGRLRAAHTPASQARVNPARPDPYALFACYPTHALHPQDRARRLPGDPRRLLHGMRSLSLTWYAEELLPDLERAVALLSRLPAEGELTIEEALRSQAPEDRPKAYRWLLWMAKCGLVQIQRAERADA